MANEPVNIDERRAGIIRTALILALVAIGIFVGFLYTASN
jgi:hypothetical protein